MKVFLSHARKDGALLRQLAEQLTNSGLAVWDPEEEFAPGDSWAKKLGKALDNSEWMLILLTRGALKSEWFRQDIKFALGSKKYEGRVFSVFVGPTLEAGKDVPWILLKLPHRQIKSANDFADVIKEIKALSARSGTSHSNRRKAQRRTSGGSR
jgi:TIR domain